MEKPTGDVITVFGGEIPRKDLTNAGEFKMDPETKKEIREHLEKPTDMDWAAPTGTPIPERPTKKRPGLPTRKRKKKPWE